MNQLGSRTSRRVSLGLLLALGLWLVARPAGAEHHDLGADWNESGVAWRSFSAGVDEARRTGRPICLVVHTTWCSDCKLYSQTFHDPRVVEQSRRFVMVRVDQEAEPAVAKRFAPDGEYIPRTFFLRSTGELLDGIRSSRTEAIYNYPEDDPAALLHAMDEALRAVQDPAASTTPAPASI